MSPMYPPMNHHKARAGGHDVDYLQLPLPVIDADSFTPVRGRRVQQPQLGDFIKTPSAPQPPKTGSRFRPLTLEDWQEIAAESSSALCAKGEIAVTGPPRFVVASEPEVGASFSKDPVVSTGDSADVIASASTSHFPFLLILERPCIEKSMLQKLPKIPSNLAVRDQEDCEKKIAVVHEVVFADRLIEEQFRRACKVSFEDEPKHVIKRVGTGGGKGEELKTQDGMIGNGVGGGMNEGGDRLSGGNGEALSVHSKRFD